jgi:hypothetical protein
MAVGKPIDQAMQVNARLDVSRKSTNLRIASEVSNYAAKHQLFIGLSEM